jgi:hypothetical protein
MYRTKVLNTLNSEFLKPIMDFVGICRSDDNGCGLLKYVGADKKDSKGKIVPTYFTSQKQDKIFTIVSSQDEFINYRSRRETLEYFNPFVKMKNALLLLLMCTPVVYEKLSSNMDDSDDDIASVICDDELAVTQEDILKKVKILQYPSKKMDDDRMLYTYKIEMDDESVIELESSSCTQIIAILMLIIKIMSYFDEPLDVIDKFNGSFNDVQVYLEELLIKYEKERTLNAKDIKKIKIENTVELYSSDDFDMFETSDEIDLTGKDDEPIEKSKDEPKKDMAINLTDKYKGSYSIAFNEQDDDILDLDYNM